MKLTSEQVKEYMGRRTDEQFRHCPDCVAEACNEVVESFNDTFNENSVTAKDLLKLLFFNDPIPALHTHSYGFHTATGRNIIETLQMKYYYYKEL